MNGRAWIAFSALSGAVFALVAPPTDWVPVAWIGLAGLACALDVELPRGDRPWLAGGARGLAFGFGANLVALRFVPRVIARFTPLPFAAGIVALALLALAQGLPWGVAGLARTALVRARVPRPLAFALAVYVATFVPSVFPWTPAGAIALWPAMLQLADAVGERGVSALVALSAGLFAYAAYVRARAGGWRRSFAAVVFGVAIPIVLALHGAWRMRALEAERALAPSAVLGLIDATVPATTRWDPVAAPGILAQLTALTANAERRGAELSVWPESAYPYVLPRGGRAGPAGEERILQRGIRGPLVVGAVMRDPGGDQYNSALAVRPDGAIGSEYDKLHLLWFGEEVPLAAQFPWLRRTFARGIGMVPGDRPVLLDLGRVKAGVLICFEDILPEAGRQAAEVAPNLLINLSNDAWFAGSDESEIHLRLSVLRAIESRRDFVRAVNLGPTSFVDAAGRIRERYDLDIPGSLVVSAALMSDGPTLYARFGDLPWLIACAAIALVFWFTNRRPQNGTSAGPPE